VNDGHHHVQIALRKGVLEEIATDICDTWIRFGFRLLDHFRQIKQYTAGIRRSVQDRRQEMSNAAPKVSDGLERCEVVSTQQWPDLPERLPDHRFVEDSSFVGMLSQVFK
jgi:hypothetical protein